MTVTARWKGGLIAAGGIVALATALAPGLSVSAGPTSVATSSQPYTFNGATTTPTDKKMRTSLSSMITVRNRVP